jgi:hypothetical protein
MLRMNLNHKPRELHTSSIPRMNSAWQPCGLLQRVDSVAGMEVRPNKDVNP